MTYIDLIQKETNRIYGPAFALFFRKSQKDHYLANIPVSKGTIINMNAIPNRYNPETFEEPFEFRPERWQDDKNEVHPMTLMGFGSGPRGCIGKQLALLESKIALVKLLKRYSKIELPTREFKWTFSVSYEP